MFSESLVSEKQSQFSVLSRKKSLFPFKKILSLEKSLGFREVGLVKSLCFGKFGLEKKSLFWFRKTGSRKRKKKKTGKKLDKVNSANRLFEF